MLQNFSDVPVDTLHHSGVHFHRATSQLLFPRGHIIELFHSVRNNIVRNGILLHKAKLLQCGQSALP